MMKRLDRNETQRDKAEMRLRQALDETSGNGDEIETKPLRHD